MNKILKMFHKVGLRQGQDWGRRGQSAVQVQGQISSSIEHFDVLFVAKLWL